MTEQPEHPIPMVVDTSKSPNAALHPVPLNEVVLTDAFWAPRRELLTAVTLPSQHEQLEATGRLDNFRRAAGKLDRPFQGIYFNDSDVYKWIEAAASALATTEDPSLASSVEAAVDVIEAAQGDDGYLNTYHTFDRAARRWENLRDMHELYCAGHLFQAAVAHYRASGSHRLLNVACRFADLICDRFGPGEEQQAGVPGHPEIEMGLVELGRATGKRRYVEQAAYFLNARGRGLIGGRAYHQDYAPFRATDRLAGHAVRALYLSAGAADLAAQGGAAGGETTGSDTELVEALHRLWVRMVTRQMYITGGMGSRHEGEAVGDDYELPNARAYAETCAGIANVMWAWRMLQLEGEAAYADVMERALYNAALPGISLDGKAYFYVNPLATDGEPEPGGEIYRRQPWFHCACCPPNIARLLAQLPGYLYSVSGDTIWVHLYAGNEATLALEDGQRINIMQRTRYPWSGQVFVEILTPGTFALKVRIPGWCDAVEERDRPTVSVNGLPYDGDVVPGTYVEVRRTWAVGDSVCLTLPMPIRQVAAHPYVLENTGRVALMRGPLLYCVESADHPGIDLRDLEVPPVSELTTSFRKDLLGGVEVIEGQGRVVPPGESWSDALYRRAERADTGNAAPINLVAIPYYAWANREPGAMQVWLRRVPVTTAAARS